VANNQSNVKRNTSQSGDSGLVCGEQDSFKNEPVVETEILLQNKDISGRFGFSAEKIAASLPFLCSAVRHICIAMYVLGTLPAARQAPRSAQTHENENGWSSEHGNHCIANRTSSYHGH
jgi:hypothetical protein